MKNRFSQLFTGLLTASTILMGSAATAEDCCCGIYGGDDQYITIHGEAIYAELCQDRPFVTSNDGATDATTTDVFFGHDWSLGFRVGTGLNVPCHEWNVQVDWTYLSNEAKASHEAPAGGTMQANLAEANAATTSSSDKFDYHVIDVTLNYPVHICEEFGFRPFGGFRTLILDRKYEETNSGGVFAGTDEVSSLKQDYQAYGLAGGFDWSFATGCDFSFFGRFGGSILRGKEDLYRTRLINTVTTHFVSEDKSHTVSSADVSFGIGYETCICDAEIGLFASYEFTHWFNVNSPVNAGTNEFNLNGVTAGAHIGF